MIAAGCAAAARAGGLDICQFYGYVPHNPRLFRLPHERAALLEHRPVQRRPEFAAVHRRYCHLDRAFDF